MRVLPIVAMLCLISIEGTATDGPVSNGKFFRSVGFSFFTQYESSPVALTPNYLATIPNPYGGASQTQFSPVPIGNNTLKFTSITIMSYSYYLRYNVVEMSNNSSLSLSLQPAIGWIVNIQTSSYSSDNGESNGPGMNANLNVPLFLEFNYGNVSTFSSDKETGFVFGLGYELVMEPAIPVETVPLVQGPTQGSMVSMNTKTAWFEPAAEFGFRFWGKENHAHEINLKFGLGSSTTYTNSSGLEEVSPKPWSVKLTYLFYLNY